MIADREEMLSRNLYSFVWNDGEHRRTARIYKDEPFWNASDYGTGRLYVHSRREARAVLLRAIITDPFPKGALRYIYEENWGFYWNLKNVITGECIPIRNLATRDELMKIIKSEINP